jgi:hypothetical protein
MYEAVKLYSYVNATKAEELGEKYFINRLYDEGKTEDFYQLAGNYLEHINPFDHRMIYRYVKVRLSKRKPGATVEKSLDLMQDALLFEPENPYYLVQIAEIYALRKDKVLALQYLQKAREAATQLGVSLLEIIAIEKQVSNLP